MDGKITINQILITLCIGGSIMLGAMHSANNKVNALEQQIDAQEKVFWDIEVTKMKLVDYFPAEEINIITKY